MQIRSYFEEKLKNKFLKNFLTLLTGSVIGQSIILFSIPFLTRLFSKEAFGIYTLFTSTVILLKTLATLNLELAIILPKRDKDAVNIFALNILMIFIFSILLLFIVFFFKNNLALFLNIEQLSNFIYLIPLSVFLLGNISALEYWNNRKNTFKNITIGTISKSATMSSSQLLTGFSSFKSIGLIPGLLVGQFLNVIILTKFSLKSLISLKDHISIKRMFYLVFKYKDIPVFNTILTFTNSLSNELPVILISKYFGFGTSGLYGLTVKISKTLPGIVGQSISLVFFNEASRLYNNDGDLHQLLKVMQKKLFIVALLIFVPVFIISYFLDFIFGNNWNEAGIYVRILLPWLFIMFLNSPISSLIEILNKQKTFLVYGIILLIARFLALYLGFTIFNDIKISLMFFSGVGVLFNLFVFIYFLKITKHSNLQQKKVYK
ncbi:lipopolysaccharide biosynthesis protein [Lutibacter citreus]|uniref:lipopolysaccharide biosynthesis protein n=1 Tax=Lutibacter citreus TaxID=2138210 RepID=UPI000DBE6B8F|nr:oligosaccharide flippase family protein [Lutibacter citreus]